MTQVSALFSFYAAGGIAAALLLGGLAKAVPQKILVISGGLSVMLCMVVISRAKSLIPLYITMTLYGAGTAFGGMPMGQIVISQWFVKARTTMMSLCGVALSLAVAGMTPVLGAMISVHGYRVTALWEGLILGGITLLTGLFLINGPPDTYGCKPYGYETVKEAVLETRTRQKTQKQVPSLDFRSIVRVPVFWAILSASFLSGLVFNAYNSQGPAFFQSIGLSVDHASYAYALCALMTTVWLFGYGLISDKTQPSIAALICGGFGALAFLFTFALRGWGGALIAAVFFAAVFPLSGIMGATLATRLFGAKEAGILVGTAAAASGAGNMTGPLVAGALFDSTGDYKMTFFIMGIALVMVIILNCIASGKREIAKIPNVTKRSR
jgi:MFS family permease